MDRVRSTAGQVIAARRGVVLSAPAETSVLDALRRMAEHDIGALVVLEGDRPVGVFSERDLARKVELQGRTAADTRVREVMTPEVLYVPPDETLARCAALMRKEQIRHLVVVENGQVVGVFSARDILEHVAAEDERHIRDLEADRLVMTTSTGSY